MDQVCGDPSRDHGDLESIGIGSAGMALLAFGLVTLGVWPTVFGASLIVLGQLWRIDRLVTLYEDRIRANAQDRGAAG